MSEENKLEIVSGTMFHSVYVNLQRRYYCDDDCLQSGCPSHIIELNINNTAGIGHIVIDGKEILYLDCNEAQAIYEMMAELIKENSK